MSSEGEVEWGLALPRPPSPLSRFHQNCDGPDFDVLEWCWFERWLIPTIFNNKIQENPISRRFSSPPSTVQEVDNMRLPVVPVVVVTEVDSMGVPVVVVTEPPADEPCVGPVSPKFLFQVGHHFPFLRFF